MQSVEDLDNAGAFEAEREVTGVSEQGHFEDVEGLKVWHTVNPFSVTVEVPHLPEEAAEESGEGPGEKISPITVFDPAEVNGGARKIVEGDPGEEWSGPEERIEDMRIEPDEEKGSGRGQEE